MMCAMGGMAVAVLLAGGVPDCSCPAEIPSVVERLRAAPWVFLGRPAEREALTQYHSDPKVRRHGHQYPVIVLRTWKDERPPFMRQGGQAVSTFDDCRAKVKVGKEQVFFANAFGELSRCLPPIPADDASAMQQLDTEARPPER